MSAYENVVAGKLRLKGKALNRGMVASRRRRNTESNISCGLMVYQMTAMLIAVGDFTNETDVHNGGKTGENDRLTPAERGYLERWQQIELQRITKAARKSHRDHIQEFIQYLANLSEHYDIPKVGQA